ncbi:hypothetical protein H8E88_05835 [candidate division KSB1 bacterium]|nr:hypothetical protein [candidate division KSB1 bacterium]MBL7094618.1 hypothetical protein [candidate division KSB1 bacterium]
MVTKELIKSEIDKVQNEYVELLYKVIKAFEPSAKTGNSENFVFKNTPENGIKLNWQEFIKNNYGCLDDASIERGEQGSMPLT